MQYNAGSFDIVIIGAGHAGIEAALACARLGNKTIVITTNTDAIGNMPCNPSIGGTAKGQLVREIDALGGEMGRAADACGTQFRMLNRGKGPAVFSPRAQEDRNKYKEYMKTALENCPNLTIRQAEVQEIVVESGAVSEVACCGGAVFECRAAIICTGTFLNGRVFIGERNFEAGPDGLYAATWLTGCLEKLGVNMRRFKTGTPARINASSVKFAELEIQNGDDEPQQFSYGEKVNLHNDCACYLTYTNSQTHDLIRGELSRSPLYSGDIHGVGPRYCPSIEDKIVRFSTKERHQVFIEPCGANSGEMYLQGVSTSLPEDVQLKFLRTIKGLEKAEIMRPGYAIEYDCIDPTQLAPTLQLNEILGLYAAGQICGTSGYEEAAGQGLVAGINAARFVVGKEEFIIERAEGYIGTLIDDIVTKGTEEPYRMMTSRSEYRLLLRQDNADLRLMERGFEAGLVTQERVEQMKSEYEAAKSEITRLNKTPVKPSEKLRRLLNDANSAPAENGILLADLLRRPEITYAMLADVDENRSQLSPKICEQVEIDVKYEGYILRQEREAQAQKKLENRLLPHDLDYNTIETLRIEARQKLAKIKPRSFGQASRISGVSPSDITALMIFVSHKNGKEA